MSKKLHLAIATHSIAESIKDYSTRLGLEPCVIIDGEYALWRTDILNLSIRHDTSCKPGELRHLGWEEATSSAFSQEPDVNGIVWENFSAQQQADEINAIWPIAGYHPQT